MINGGRVRQEGKDDKKGSHSFIHSQILFVLSLCARLWEIIRVDMRLGQEVVSKGISEDMTAIQGRTSWDAQARLFIRFPNLTYVLCIVSIFALVSVVCKPEVTAQADEEHVWDGGVRVVAEGKRF